MYSAGMNPHEGAFVQGVTCQPCLTREGSLLRLVAIVAVALGMSLGSYSQEPLPEVKCTVVDEMGAVIPRAEVVFKGQSGTTISHTGLDGVVTQVLRTGRYAVWVNQPGFVTTVLRDFDVAGTTRPTCRIVLKVGDRPTDDPERRPAAVHSPSSELGRVTEHYQKD